jgi:hypothetical protein
MRQQCLNSLSVVPSLVLRPMFLDVGFLTRCQLPQMPPSAPSIACSFRAASRNVIVGEMTFTLDASRMHDTAGPLCKTGLRGCSAHPRMSSRERWQPQRMRSTVTKNEHLRFISPQDRWETHEHISQSRLQRSVQHLASFQTVNQQKSRQ